MSAIKDILDKIDKLSPADQERLKTILFSKTFTKSISIEEFVTKERFANGRVCPVCGATHVVRNGKRKDGTQKYICKDCGKSFVITTNSIVSGTRKDLNVWIKYVDCLLNGFSVRKAAEECGIHRNTAFAWRHKILDALQNMANDVILDGIVEKGSITIDGISLTVANVNEKSFKVSIIPHTREQTTLGHKKVGEYVNLENDLLGKYVQKFMSRQFKEKHKEIQR